MAGCGHRPAWRPMPDHLTDASHALGLEPGAPWEQVRAAHRRLAKELHPDLTGGDARSMATVNIAFATIAAARQLQPEEEPPSVVVGGGSDDDPVTFSVNVLPVEAFEAV